MVMSAERKKRLPLPQKLPLHVYEATTTTT